MPRQFGKVDISATWACVRCPYKHAPLAACPSPGVWLVLALCPACNERTGLYCRTHRDRHMPQVAADDAHHTLPVVPEQAVVAARYEHEEDAT